MRRTVQSLAIASAVLGLSLAALPATASTPAVAAAAVQRTARAPRHDQPANAAPTPAQLGALARAERVRALTGQTGAIAGIVRGADGAPRANVCVTASGPTGTRTAFSRANGGFLISGLRFGAYRVRYRGCSPIGRFVGQWYGGLTRSSATRVLVTSGRPAQLAPVTLSEVSPQIMTRAAGPRLTDPGIRLVMLVAAARSGQLTRAGAAASVKIARVSGRVTGRSGGPLGGICVLAVGVNSGLFDPNTFEAQTSKSGGYTIGIPQAGRYRILFLSACASKGNFAPQLWKGAGSVASARVLRVGRGQVIRHIDAVLRTGAAISGQLRSASAQHRSFAGVCILATGLGGQRLFEGFATARANGMFRLPDLATGKYRLQFYTGCSQQPASYLPMTLRKPVTVTDGKTTTGITADLRLGGTITGVVKNSAGHPLRGICVSAFSKSRSGIEIGPEVPTGAGGFYQLPGLASGSYQMQFATGCGNNGPYAALALPDLVRVTAGKTTAHVDAVMALAGMISGVVRNSGGRPLSGICVAAMDASNGGFAFVSTSARGTYRAGGLPAGQYQLQFIPGGVFSNCGNNGNFLPVTLTATANSGMTTTLNATLPTGGVISGVVKDSAGHPLAGVCAFSTSPSGGQVSTASDGSYRLTQLFSGGYFVGFAGGCGNRQSVAALSYRDDPTFLDPATVPVTAGQATPGIDVAMQPGGTITGHVTDESGRPLTRICVFVIGVTGAGGLGFFADQEVTRDGTYESTNLSPGQFTVSFGGVFGPNGCVTSGRYADQVFRARTVGSSPDLVSADAGAITSGVSAALAPAGSLSGIIRNRAGRPVANSCVTAINPRTQAEGQAFADSSGGYTLTDIPAGRYRVEFSNCAALLGFAVNSYANQWYRNRATEGSATAVIVRARHTARHIDAALTAGGSIQGQVVYGPHNRPVSFVCVNAFTANSSQFSQGLTDRRGHYVVSGLSTGSYFVDFVPCSPENTLVAQVLPAPLHIVAGRTVRGVNARLKVGGSVSGVVTASGPHGLRPAPGACVEVLPTGRFGLGTVTMAAAGGAYSAANLGPGQYSVFFGDPNCSIDSPALAPRSYSRLVQVTAAHDTTGISATLALDGGISGVVKGRGGRPVSGICAEVVPLAGGASHVIGVTAAGRYHVIDLVPGRYKVSFSAGCGATGYATRWYKNARSRQQATIIQVSANKTTTGISITLPRD